LQQFFDRSKAPPFSIDKSSINLASCIRSGMCVRQPILNQPKLNHQLLTKIGVQVFGVFGRGRRGEYVYDNGYMGHRGQYGYGGGYVGRLLPFPFGEGYLIY
jgi:hypothetical protein